MFKVSFILSTALVIAGCGGSSDNPFSVNEITVDSGADEPTTPATGDTGNTIPDPIVQSDPVAGECIDTAPVGDGFGWNGVGSCTPEVNSTEDNSDSGDNTGSGDNTADPSVEPQTPVNDQQSPAGFGEGVDGRWYCASTGTDDTGQYRADWNNTWQLEFNDDQTVTLLDGSNSVSTWWYTGSGVAIQWSHNGNSTVYLPNVNNLGGMADDGSHCLRELPPTDPNGSTPLADPVSYTITVPNGDSIQSTAYAVTRDDFVGQRWSCGLVYWNETPFIEGHWTTGPNSTQTWDFDADGTGNHYQYRGNGDQSFTWRWTADGVEVTRNSDGGSYLFMVNNSVDSSYWAYTYPVSGVTEIRPVGGSGEYSGGYGCRPF